MTDANTQQTDQGTSDQGASGSSDAGAGGGAAEAWYAKFGDEGIRTNPAIQKFKGPEDLAASYVNLEKRFGVDPARRIDLPADPNDAEGMRAVYTKLGLPENPDGYGLKLDDKATEADKTMLSDFAKTAHELGVPPAHAKGLMDFWMGKVAAAAEAQTQSMNQAAEEGTAELKKTWGAAYDGRMREIGRLLQENGDQDLISALDASNMGRHPQLAKFLGKMMDRMAEPGGQGPGGGGGDVVLTPDQAKAARLTLEGDPVKGKALNEASHPQHKAVVAERIKLLRMENARTTA